MMSLNDFLNMTHGDVVFSIYEYSDLDDVICCDASGKWSIPYKNDSPIFSLNNGTNFCCYKPLAFLKEKYANAQVKMVVFMHDKICLGIEMNKPYDGGDE